MKKPKDAPLKPSSLQKGLLITNFMIFVICAVAFYFAQGWLTDLAIKKHDDPAADQRQLQSTLISQKDNITKANGLTASISNYSRVFSTDINKYAGENNITISSLSPTQASDSNMALPAGVQVKYFNVSIKGPLAYDNFLKFVKRVESGYPKMQIDKLSITSTGSGSVNINSIVAGIYVR